ncbi:MAG: diphosphate--fructose-6-phosphate 1-phosphotransferase [Candidatus Limiplasma sp.]|nr:diphosphate--fructose-6-phosphate 1-phosphotransferase [Candidatus Limiplasma sp.]
MTRNALYIQSGGPTAVINASAYGVICESRENPDRIGRLYAARYGSVGVLGDQLVDTASFEESALALLPHTPSMAFGSSRYRMTDPEQDDADYRRYLEILRKHDIGYLFLNGGNGTLASAIKLNRYLMGEGYDCKVMVIPKTVDNDIEGIDHSPGFPSAARYVILSVSELTHDIRSYDTGLITVAEVMGRNTGWLAAATLAAGIGGNGPDLIYVPEARFSHQEFLEDVRRVWQQKQKCLVVVAEGIKDETGRYVFEQQPLQEGDPTVNMGGAALHLAGFLRRHFDCKVRSLDLGLMQRCAAHAASELDVGEAMALGRRAVREALHGASARMVSLERVEDFQGVRFAETLVDLERAALGGHPLPARYITPSGCYIHDSFLSYLLPLVGELPRYAKAF